MDNVSSGLFTTFVTSTAIFQRHHSTALTNECATAATQLTVFKDGLSLLVRPIGLGFGLLEAQISVLHRV